jgi:hypothetical protein
MWKDIIDRVSVLAEDQEIKTTLTPDLIERLGQYLKLKHWVDINRAIFQFTRDEVASIKVQLKATQNPEYVWQQFFDKEAIEANLRNDWIKAIDIERVTFWIENSRMDYIKREFDKIIVPFLDKYDFLDKNTKNILKLAIANKVLSNNEIFSEVESSLKSIWASIKWFDNKTHAETQAESDKLKKQGYNTSNEIEAKIMPIINEYSGVFESIDKKFKTEGWNLTPEQKQAVISNVPFFRSPSLMEKWASAFDISKIDMSKKNVNNNFDLEEVKKYIYDSRKNVEKMAWLFQSWDEASETIYSLMNSWELIGWAVKWFLDILLSIPIFWKWIAIFLWLDPNHPMEDLEQNAWLYRFFWWFIWLWRTTDNKEWKGILKYMDLKDVNFNILKWDIKSIKWIVPNLKPEEYNSFWEKAFSEWYDAEDGFKVKFELSDTQKGKTKLNTSDVKEIFKNLLEKHKVYQDDKALKESELAGQAKQKEVGDRTTTTRASLSSLQLQISSIDKIASNAFDQIPNWQNMIYGDINDVELSSVVNNTSSDFSTIILGKISKENYEKLTQENKDFLNQLFSYIKEYVNSQKGFKIEW